MCLPQAVAAGLTLATTALSTATTIQGARRTSRFNARVQENQAQLTKNQGVVEENRHRRAIAQTVAAQRGALAASGVDVDTGSALALQQDTEVFGGADALTIRSNYDAQASSLQQQAAATRDTGDAQALTALTSGLGQLGSTAVNSKWYQNKLDKGKLNSTPVSTPYQTRTKKAS